MKKGNMIAIIYTSLVLVQPLQKMFKSFAPNLKIMNIVDDSLIEEVIRFNEVTPRVIKCICSYAMIAEDAGASLILNSCSSVSEVVDIAKFLVRIPIIKIDESMAAEAVSMGKNIGVVSTLKSTLKPTTRLLMKKASEKRKETKIITTLCNGAYQALLRNDLDKHDKIILKEIRKLSNAVDCIVLAQGSMARLIPLIREERTPVLSSLEFGVKEVLKILGKTKK